MNRWADEKQMIRMFKQKKTTNIMSFRRKKQISFLKRSEIIYFLKGKALKEISYF